MNEMAYRDILLLLDVEPENKPGLKEKRKLEKDLHSRSRDAIRSRIEKDKKEATEKIRKKEEEKKKKKSREEAKLRKTQEAAGGGGGGGSSSSSSASSGSTKTSASSSGGGAPPAKVNINRDDIVKDESSESSELMRGYKKTKDGKTTSYFTRELDEHAKALMGDIAPKKLTGSGEAARPVERKTSAASAWNSAGTFEERDRSKFCADMLEEKIGNGMVVVESEEYKVEVTGIKKIEGEGSIILRRGKMSFIWDYAFDVTYKISLISNDKICKGTLSFTDFSHDPNDLPSVRKKIIGSGFKNVEDVAVGKRATSALRQRLDEVLNAFRDECKEELGGQ
jgi:activator of HSP90 ATPase